MNIVNLLKTKLFEREDSKLYLKNGLLFLAVTLLVTLLISFMFWIVIYINLNFFISQGVLVSEEFKMAYLDFVLTFLIEILYWILGFSIIVFFAGVYAAKIMVRPFQIIGRYSRRAREDNTVLYESDKLSDFKVLQDFSHLFFEHLKKCIRNKEVLDFKMSKQFNEIREFRGDKTFIFNFLLFFSTLTISITWFFVAVANEIQSSTLELAFKLLPSNKISIFNYLKKMDFIWDMIIFVAVLIIIISYVLLARHLYNLFSGASLSYFLTMKSFLKGNFGSRIHLVGFKYIRPHARYLNKYLDHFCRELKINIKK